MTARPRCDWTQSTDRGDDSTLHLDELLIDSEQDVAAIIHAPARKPTLQTLVVRKCAITSECMAALSVALASDRHWRKLDFQYSRLSLEAICALASALQRNEVLDTLVLCSVELTDDGCEVLAAALAENTALRSLTIIFNRLSIRSATAISQMLQVNRTLQELSLNGNRLGAGAIAALAIGLRVNPTLRALQWRDGSINAEDGMSIATALLDGQLALETFEVIPVSSKDTLDDASAEVLARALETDRTLQSLTTVLDGRGLAAIAQMLQVNTTLMTLDLSQHPMEASDLVVLANALAGRSSLRTLMLCLQHADQQHVGVTALAHALCVNTSLQTLRLIFTVIDAIGAMALAEALQTNQTLQKLKVTEPGRDADTILLPPALGATSRLRSLAWTLSQSSVDDAVPTMLAQSLRANTMLHTLVLHLQRQHDACVRCLSVLGDALQVNTTLRSLELWCRCEGADSTAAIATALQVNTTLQELRFIGVTMDDAAATTFARGLQHNRALTALALRFTTMESDGMRAILDALAIHSTVRTADFRTFFGTSPISWLGDYRRRIQRASSRVVAFASVLTSNRLAGYGIQHTAIAPHIGWLAEGHLQCRLLG